MAWAAESAGVDATTLGRRLRRLEGRLNATFFERSRDGHVLNEAGEKLFEVVEAMARMASTIDDGADLQSGPSGTVRLSVPEGFGAWIVSRHVPALVEAFPRITLDMVASSGFLDPSRREADLAVMLSRPKAGPLIARKLCDYALQLYASAGYLAKHGMPQIPGELRVGHRLVGYIPDLIHSPELRYLSEFLPDLAATVRSSSIGAQLRIVAQGGGIGVLPCFMADAALVPVLPQTRIVRSFWLVTHRETHSFARIKAARDWLDAAVRKDRQALLPDPAHME